MTAARTKLRVACLQNNASDRWDKNLADIFIRIDQILRSRPQIIALPENFYYRGNPSLFPFLAEWVSPEVIRGFQSLAKRSETAFLLGGLLEKSGTRNKFYNTSVAIDEKGRIAGKYRKMHLFEVKLGALRTREADELLAGKTLVSAKLWGIPVALSICFDLRFPELYRKLALQTRIAFVPANFTYTTGKAHWEILLRARAIENQMFVIAPALTGVHPYSKIKSFGSSMIIDPWGTVLQKAPVRGQGVVIQDLDLNFQRDLRRNFPVLTSKKLI